MTYKANVSFAGEITMRINEVRELPESEAVLGLVSCGYLSKVGVKNEVNADENKRNTNRKRKENAEN